MHRITYINIFFILSVFTLYSSEERTLALKSTNQQLPVVYHPGYDITFGGLEKYHPFDTTKYSKVHNALINTIRGMSANSFYTPDMVTETELKMVHTPEYLESLNDSSTLARICGIHCAGAMAYYAASAIPNILWRRYLLNPMRYATGGTIKATELALENKGYAINLSGGYHHAKKNGDHDGGFCAINDIALATKIAWKKNPNLKRIFICDLDAHLGNGNADYFGNANKTGKWQRNCIIGGTEFIQEPDDNEQKVTIFDMFSYPNYPYCDLSRMYIKYQYQFSKNDSSEFYLNTLKTYLPKAIEESKPQLIFYNAGTDPYKGDALGRMNLSKEDIIERDAFVFQQAKENGIPIVMTLSGGYSSESANIITSSIQNILLNVTEDIGPYPS